MNRSVHSQNCNNYDQTRSLSANIDLNSHNKNNDNNNNQKKDYEFLIEKTTKSNLLQPRTTPPTHNNNLSNSSNIQINNNTTNNNNNINEIENLINSLSTSTNLSSTAVINNYLHHGDVFIKFSPIKD